MEGEQFQMEIVESMEAEPLPIIRPQELHQDQSTTRSSKVVVGLFLFSIVITCAVSSKLSLVWLVSGLNSAPQNDNPEDISKAVGYYWQLLLVLLIPQFVTFFRTLFFGVCGKQSRTFPWPTRRAILTGLVASVFEVLAMCCIVFYVLPRLPPTVAILVQCAVFPFQALVDCFYLQWCACRQRCYQNAYDDIDAHEHLVYREPKEGRLARWRKKGAQLVENKFTRIAALLIQLLSIVAMAICAFNFLDHDDKVLPIAIVVSFLVLSVVWSTKVQQESNRAPNVARRNHGPSIIRERETTVPIARYKAGFINSSIQIVLYIIASYLFCSLQRSDWCLKGSYSFVQSFQWVGQDLTIFLIQILSSFFGYVFMWISCTMALHRWGLALPMYLCTPISVVTCMVIEHASKSTFFHSIPYTNFKALIIIGVLLWVGQMLTMGVFIWKKSNVILAKDGDMFLMPKYNGVFLEQHTLLNRQVKKGKKSKGTVTSTVDKLRPRTIFVCSTMYREDIDEMRQMLSSIYQLACYYQHKKEEDPAYRDHFESHIFLDGGANGAQLSQYALQLFSLFEETLHVDPKVFQRLDTPYGCQLSWDIGEAMPIYVHLKDGYKVKNKKRWSQVMYMSYVLNFRVKKNIRNLRHRRLRGAAAKGEDDNKMDDDNTFILTTDADIQFTPESAIVLLDRLDSDPQVGAVCARTHPQGSGPLYWYQVFDYAIGHWFQKAAEDIMGTVLCCPGCFSVFRCRALRSVLDTYSTEVTSASEFLTKDMGEDRWLCTLLVEEGWRLSYCAISENYTHCPESMDEFFKQRRRWIPSTVANLALLISHASQIIKGNDRISILFVIFEAIMVFSTAISPATVILVIVAGITSSFGVDPVPIIVLILIFCVGFALLCLYGDPQLQLDVAMVCTFFFSLLMGVVMVGYVTNITQDVQNFTLSLYNYSGVGPLPTFLTPSTIYLVIFALVFLIAALLHPSEWSCLLHFVWYLIALPSGYLLLLIYSAANLDNRSWGTREGSKGGQVGIYSSATSFARKVWTRLTLCADQCTCRPVIPPTTEHKAPPLPALSTMQPSRGADMVDEDEFQLTDEVNRWLDRLECGQFAQNFRQGGYFTVHFIAAMKSEDYIAIGITDRGHRLRLEREAKRLPSLPIEKAIPNDVVDWLQKLELQGYQRLFAACGYDTKEDLESVKGLTVDDLKNMGIHRRAHHQRILEGTNRLAYPSAVDISISQSKVIIENSSRQMVKMEGEGEEKKFWDDLVHSSLEPMKAGFISDNDLKEKLKSLRNTVLCLMLLINIMWIVLLYTLKIPINEQYKIPEQTLTLLFLGLYTFILLVQFVAMLVHRCITLVHYLARAGPRRMTE